MRLVTAKQAADIIGVSVKTIYRNIDTIPHIKIGRSIRVDIEKVTNYEAIQNKGE